MKTFLSIASVLVGLAVTALPAKAQVTYYGPGVANGNGVNDGAGISSVVVNNDANNITFTINSSQPMASYIFYAIELQIVGQAANGSTSLVNPWGEQVGISTGENALINTYGTGASALTYAGVRGRRMLRRLMLLAAPDLLSRQLHYRSTASI